MLLGVADSAGAHRAHIALEELQLPFKEEIVDLDTPRTPEYLAINPRGLVPTISYNGAIVPESAIVSWLIADENPSHLAPASNAPGGGLARARIAFFVDAYFSKFQGGLVKLFGAQTEAEREPIVANAVAVAVKELEPQLQNAAPYFGGSDKLTMAEVLTGSFVIRLLTLTRAGLYSSQLATELEQKTPKFWAWAQKVAAHPSVTKIYDEERVIASTKARIAKAQAAAAK
jgi:glutathione S-transferase